MVKKVKGLAVFSLEAAERFKFTDEGKSSFGATITDLHTLKGLVSTTNSVDLQGELELGCRKASIGSDSRQQRYRNLRTPIRNRPVRNRPCHDLKDGEKACL